jgi:protease secretion system outer membrane protein
VAAAVLGLASVQSAGAMGLVEAYEAALRHDPSYRAAVHEHEAGQQFEALGRAQLLPAVSATYGRFRNSADVTSSSSGTPVTDHRNYNSLAASIQLRQPLFHPEGLARMRQGVAQARGSDAQLSLRGQELIVRVVTLYTFARYAQEQLAQAEAQREALAAQLAANQRLLQRGEGTRTDLLETEARHALAVAQVLEARDGVTNGRNALAAIVGTDPGTLDALGDEQPGRAGPVRSFEEWQAIAVASNPELRTVRQAVEVAREEVNRQRAGHLPRLDLVASAGKNDSETVNTFNQRANVRSVGLQLTLPLYAGGATTAAAVQAEANLLKAQADLDGRTGQMLVELRKQYDLTASSAARQKAAQAALDASVALVDAMRRSVRGGQRTNLDVLIAQQQLFEARRDLAQARYNHVLSRLRLRHAAGTLQASDLMDIAAAFTRTGG